MVAGLKVRWASIDFAGSRLFTSFGAWAGLVARIILGPAHRQVSSMAKPRPLPGHSIGHCHAGLPDPLDRLGTASTRVRCWRMDQTFPYVGRSNHPLGGMPVVPSPNPGSQIRGGNPDLTMTIKRHPLPVLCERHGRFFDGFSPWPCLIAGFIGGGLVVLLRGRMPRLR